jgi:hypothetical protein
MIYQVLRVTDVSWSPGFVLNHLFKMDFTKLPVDELLSIACHGGFHVGYSSIQISLVP